MNARSIVSRRRAAPRSVSAPGAMRSSIRSATPAAPTRAAPIAVHSSETSQQSRRPSAGKPARDAQRRVAGERADLDRRPRADAAASAA